MVSYVRFGGQKKVGLRRTVTVREWSRAFGGVPVHTHADDQRWIMRADPCVKLWQGETLTLLPEVTLIRGGAISRAVACCIGQRVRRGAACYAGPTSPR